MSRLDFIKKLLNPPEVVTEMTVVQMIKVALLEMAVIPKTKIKQVKNRPTYFFFCILVN